jgi:hypothetical protein
MQLKFLAGEMPIVLIDNPQRTESPNHVESSLLWAWRDMGETTDTVGRLPELIEHYLLHPLDKSDRRESYRQQLFGDFTDGRSALRLIEQVDSLAEQCAPDEDALTTTWPFLTTRAILRGLKRASHRKAAAL